MVLKRIPKASSDENITRTTSGGILEVSWVIWVYPCCLCRLVVSSLVCSGTLDFPDKKITRVNSYPDNFLANYPDENILFSTLLLLPFIRLVTVVLRFIVTTELVPCL